MVVVVVVVVGVVVGVVAFVVEAVVEGVKTKCLGSVTGYRLTEIEKKRFRY